MEPDSREAVLGDPYLIGEIMIRTGSSKSFIRAANVNNIWYETSKSPAILDLFARGNKQSFLGFVVEYKTYLGQELQLMQPALAPGNETLDALDSGFDGTAFSDLPVMACNGALVLSVVQKPGQLEAGYYAKCPFASSSPRRYVGSLIPPIPLGDGQHTKNTFGQYGILMQTGRDPSSPMGFFVKEVAQTFIPSYAGIRFNSSEPVFVHVSVFQNGLWERFVSQPLAPPPFATFHRNPYCVLVDTKLFMMYLVGYIVCFDFDQASFTVIPLPGDLPEKANSWFDYTVSKGVRGGLSLVHFRDGYIVKWAMTVTPEGFTWQLDSTFNLAPAIGALIQNEFAGAQLVDVEIEWGSVQLRSASQGCRYVFMSVELNAGLFIADTVEKTVINAPNVAQEWAVGRIFKLEEHWHPKP